MRSVKQVKQRRVFRRRERGDTLIEVTLALAILSMTLSGAFSIATKAFQLATTARDRSAIAFEAQSQMEAIRSFRDNHIWDVFTNGSATPSIPGVLGASTTGCHVLPECFHMEESGGLFVPIGGPTTSSVPGSYIEIQPTPTPTTDPTVVQFNVAWGFPGVGSSPANKGHFETQLVNLRLGTPTAVAPPAFCNRVPPNYIQNGNFAIDGGPGPDINPSARFDSDLPNRNPNVYPDDGGTQPGSALGWRGGFSIQTGDKTYTDGLHVINGRTFPAHPATQSPASNTYFYSNPNQSFLDPTSTAPFTGVLWRQPITGLTIGKTYSFTAYFDNLLDEGDPGVDPIITLLNDGVVSGGPYTVPKTPDTWMPVTAEFVATTSSVELAIRDDAGDVNGDDFAMTALGMYECN